MGLRDCFTSTAWLDECGLYFELTAALEQQSAPVRCSYRYAVIVNILHLLLLTPQTLPPVPRPSLYGLALVPPIPSPVGMSSLISIVKAQEALYGPFRDMFEC